jgi:hypothetical protein
MAVALRDGPERVALSQHAGSTSRPADCRRHDELHANCLQPSNTAVAVANARTGRLQLLGLFPVPGQQHRRLFLFVRPDVPGYAHGVGRWYEQQRAAQRRRLRKQPLRGRGDVVFGLLRVHLQPSDQHRHVHLRSALRQRYKSVDVQLLVRRIPDGQCRRRSRAGVMLSVPTGLRGRNDRRRAAEPHLDQHHIGTIHSIHGIDTLHGVLREHRLESVADHARGQPSDGNSWRVCA